MRVYRRRRGSLAARERRLDGLGRRQAAPSGPPAGILLSQSQIRLDGERRNDRKSEEVPPTLGASRSPINASLKDDKGPMEAHSGNGEVNRADDRHDEEFGPDNIEAGRPIENGLGES